MFTCIMKKTLGSWRSTAPQKMPKTNHPGMVNLKPLLEASVLKYEQTITYEIVKSCKYFQLLQYLDVLFGGYMENLFILHDLYQLLLSYKSYENVPILVQSENTFHSWGIHHWPSYPFGQKNTDRSKLNGNEKTLGPIISWLLLPGSQNMFL